MSRPYNFSGTVTPPHERVLARVIHEDRGHPTPCWIWPGSASAKNKSAPEGYGCIMTGSRSDDSRKLRRTHQVMFEWAKGPVPEDCEIDHLCHQTICCNPDHLEAVTHQENASTARVRPEVVASRIRDGRERLSPLGAAARRRS